MQTISPDVLLAQLNWRYAVKKFDPARKIAPATWSALEKAAQLAPSSYGLSPWRFVVVNDAATRAKLRAVSWNQPQITDASHLVVFCRRLAVTPADIERYIQRIAEVRGVPIASLDGYKQMMLGSSADPTKVPGGSMETWTRSQVYISLGFFLSAAALLGVDACPMEGFDPSKYDEILGLRSHGFTAAVVATAGYRAADDGLAMAKKVRPPEQEVVVHV